MILENANSEVLLESCYKTAQKKKKTREREKRIWLPAWIIVGEETNYKENDKNNISEIILSKIHSVLQISFKYFILFEPH